VCQPGFEIDVIGVKYGHLFTSFLHNVASGSSVLIISQNFYISIHWFYTPSNPHLVDKLSPTPHEKNNLESCHIFLHLKRFTDVVDGECANVDSRGDASLVQPILGPRDLVKVPGFQTQ
jgi:hypothetical protein